MKNYKKFKITPDIIEDCLEESLEKIIVNKNKSRKQK